MAMAFRPFKANKLRYNAEWLERILFQICDEYDIRTIQNNEPAILVGAIAVIGGILGGYAGGRMGAVLGASIATVAGVRVATEISFRELWETFKEKLQELLVILFNYLRQLDVTDYARAFDILMASRGTRKELVNAILSFLTEKLGREVVSSITAM